MSTKLELDSCSLARNRESGPRSVKDEADSAKATDTKLEKSRKEEELKLQEEEDLQLAIALSRSEAEHKDKERGKPPLSSRSYASPVKESPTKVPASAEIDDPELARYLNRSYWEQKQQQEKDLPREKEKSLSINDSPLSHHHPSAPVTSVVTSPNNVHKTSEVCETHFHPLGSVSDFASLRIEVSEW